MDFPDCTEERSDPRIVISDKGAKNQRSRLAIENPNQQTIKIVQIDDCVIQEGLRCDRLLLAANRAVLVELKGNDVEKAIHQIEASIAYLKQQCSSFSSQEVTGIIYCTRCPLSVTDIQNHKVRFQKKHQAKLLVKSGELTYAI